MIKATINNQTREFKEGIFIIEATASMGIEIPTLCHVKQLDPYASCWLCVVEVYGKPNRIVPSCSTMLMEGMIIQTDNERVINTRKMALELLLSDHFGDCIAPCSLDGCPANIDIQGFLKLVAIGKYVDAASLIREKAPLLNILGRVCPKPCESKCRRNRVDEPVLIGVQKRYIAEKEWEIGGPFFPVPLQPKKKNISIVGCGPAGISCAYYLALDGYKVTIYEKFMKSGGMMRYGIPYYRLPDEVISYELDTIIDKLGIDVKYGIEVGKDISLQEILNSSDSVVLAHGAQLSNQMGIAGEQEEQVINALDMLFKLGNHENINLGKNILVVGGGHTAIDSARSAVRLGSEVKVLYRRSVEEMPAKAEIHEAEEEGVAFEFLTAPVSIKRQGGLLLLTCVRMQLSEPDSSGRKRPVPVEGSEFVLEADNIISAIGQSVDNTWFDKAFLTEKGYLNTNSLSSQFLDNNKIFATGDCVSGPALVVTAVATGRKTAKEVSRYLSGLEVVDKSLEFNSRCGNLEALPAEMFDVEKYPRAKITNLDKDVRKSSFAPIEASLSEEVFREQAMRCLECGCVEIADCKLRSYSDIYKADQNKFCGEKRKYDKDFSRPVIRIENDKCINCGSCVRVCEEVKKLDIFGYIGRGFSSKIKPEFDHKLLYTDCDACGECTKVCPTAGVSKDKSNV